MLHNFTKNQQKSLFICFLREVRLVTNLLHQIDRGGGTVVEIPEQVTSTEHRDRYVVRSLMEEAITSSQLEGAATTREVAKKMPAEG